MGGYPSRSKHKPSQGLLLANRRSSTQSGASSASCDTVDTPFRSAGVASSRRAAPSYYSSVVEEEVFSLPLDDPIFKEMVLDTNRNFEQAFTTAHQQVLGKGMCGDVTVVARVQDLEQFALKTIQASSGHMEAVTKVTTMREIETLRSLSHPHVVKLFEVNRGAARVSLVLELCRGGDLLQYLKSVGFLAENHAATLVSQMIKAISYLHSKSIVHRDIKLENWLLRSRGSLQVALTDFGLCTTFGDSKETGPKATLGTRFYMAPEIGQRESYGPECDVWSLGAQTYIMLSGRPPFTGETHSIVREKARTMNPSFSSSRWSPYSTSVRDFILALLRKNPKERISLDRALGHPWIASNLGTNALEDAHVEPILAGLKAIQCLSEWAVWVLKVGVHEESEETPVIAKARELFDYLNISLSGALGVEDFMRIVTAEHSELVGRVFDKLGDGREFLNYLDLKTILVAAEENRIEEFGERGLRIILNRLARSCRISPAAAQECKGLELLVAGEVPLATKVSPFDDPLLCRLVEHIKQGESPEAKP